MKTYYQRNKKEILKKLRTKYQENESYRNMIKEKYKSKYHEDEDYRKATVERSKVKYQKTKEIIAKSLLKKKKSAD